MNRNKSIFVLVVAIVLVTAACGKRDGGPGTTAAGSIKVQEIQLGNQVDYGKTVVTRMENFSPTDTIYASVRTTGAGAGARLTARWTYEGGQVVDETSQTVAAGDSVTEFHISKPDGWPAGRYKVEILVNGQSQGSKNFGVS